MTKFDKLVVYIIAILLLILVYKMYIHEIKIADTNKKITDIRNILEDPNATQITNE